MLNIKGDEISLESLDGLNLTFAKYEKLYESKKKPEVLHLEDVGLLYICLSF